MLLCGSTRARLQLTEFLLTSTFLFMAHQIYGYSSLSLYINIMVYNLVSSSFHMVVSINGYPQMDGL